jgi:dihydrodipicolinate synthase/N-acetylneuraminate lyase
MQLEDARLLHHPSPPVVHQILDRLGVRASPRPRAPAREPDWEQVDLGYDGFEAA